MSYQQRLFDGYTVTHERGTLSSFSIEDEDIKHFRADDVVVLVVTATIAGGAYKHDTSGDWVRTNKLVTHEVRVADGVMKDEIVEFYNLAGDQLAFSRPSGSAMSPAMSSQGPPGNGSTQVEPGVASSGNTGESSESSESGSDQGVSDPHVGNAARDQVLAAFLDET